MATGVTPEQKERIQALLAEGKTTNAIAKDLGMSWNKVDGLIKEMNPEVKSADVGRPLKFKTVQELQEKIDDYFESCKNIKGDLIRPYTITGLALALDTSRKVLLDYENRDDEYSYTIKKAKLRIENFAEESLFTSKQTAGVIFNLKNNYGWQDKQEVGLNGGLNNTNQDLTSMTAEERRERIDELNRRRGNGTPSTA